MKIMKYMKVKPFLFIATRKIEILHALHVLHGSVFI